MLPAQAGVILWVRLVLRKSFNAPRAGGGDPILECEEVISSNMLPAQAGVIPRPAAPVICTPNAPRQAGVILDLLEYYRFVQHAPRAGGGDPITDDFNVPRKICSPRRRG